MKFVVVEDEIRIREGIRRLLEKLDSDYIVAGEAENGQEALPIIREAKPDIVITDVRMPIMDGLEMLQQLKKEEIRTKAIVLSAYSDFEYARTAMRMGVTEYLVKPIALNDFTTAIENIKQQMMKESREKPEQLGTLEQVLKGLISGGIDPEREVLEYLEEKYAVSSDMPLALLLHYFPHWDPQEVKRTEKNAKTAIGEEEKLSCCSWRDEKKKILCFIIYQFKDSKSLKRRIQSHLPGMPDYASGKVIGWAEAETICNVKDRYEKLAGCLDWNISFGDNIMISWPEAAKIQTALCVYPLEIEEQMKNAVCKGAERTMQKCVDRFHQYFQGKKVYEPRQIKECYIRFFWAVMNYAKEMHYFDYREMEQQLLLEKIMGARTMQELKEAAVEIVGRIRPQDSGSINHMQVKRAVALIHEFYQRGITLDEIAQKLEITPEYLGTQFHREMGMNFSTYIKNYRIKKAKELLLGTKLKIYEIAEKTGYTDPKYFSKVFKETTGQLPAEYRTTHR